VIDTGVNKNHPDLNVTFCRDATGRKIRNRCNDQIGHGTHVAGSAAASGGEDGLGIFGTAPSVELGVEKICTTLCWQDDLIRGIEDGTERFQPDVITLSFSATDTDLLRNAVEAAVNSGALFLASAGNNGPGADTISYPAAYPEVVAVGMLDAARIVNRMSSRGSDDENDSGITDREVELAGGGFVIESTSMNGCYEVMSGTSMATPSVAGFAAANWQDSNDDPRSFLRNFSVDIDNSARFGLEDYDDTTSGYDASSGYGMPQDGGIEGNNLAAVYVPQANVSPDDEVSITVTGTPNSMFRIGVTSPSGDWTYGEFMTDYSGKRDLTLTPWTDPGTWLITVDFGGGAIPDFGAAYGTFEQITP
jgi:subtilisin